MLKTFQIDFVRAVFGWELEKNSFTDNELFNNDDISLFSFYEHLEGSEEIDRYVERYQDLANQQNRADLVGFGILATSSTPSITNVMSSFISPFEWSCSIRCNLANRDTMISTIYDLIEKLKGRKVDIAQLENGKLVPVGTLFQNSDTNVLDYDYIGTITNVSDVITIANGLSLSVANTKYVYAQLSNKLVLCENIGTQQTPVFQVSKTYGSFEKYKLDLSFDDIKIDQPYTLNANEYCTFSFGGSATLCNNSIKLGNDLVALWVAKDHIKGETDYEFAGNYVSLEPLELPSGSSSNQVESLLRSNYFKQNSHTDSIAITMQYSFNLDLDIPLIKQWFEYGRYGINGLSNGQLNENCITPNIIYAVREIWSSWGNVSKYNYKGKIVEDIDIEINEADTMTIGISMQVQGDN